MVRRCCSYPAEKKNGFSRWRRDWEERRRPRQLRWLTSLTKVGDFCHAQLRALRVIRFWRQRSTSSSCLRFHHLLNLQCTESNWIYIKSFKAEDKTIFRAAIDYAPYEFHQRNRCVLVKILESGVPDDFVAAHGTLTKSQLFIRISETVFEGAFEIEYSCSKQIENPFTPIWNCSPRGEERIAIRRSFFFLG